MESILRTIETRDIYMVSRFLVQRSNATFASEGKTRIRFGSRTRAIQEGNTVSIGGSKEAIKVFLA